LLRYYSEFRHSTADAVRSKNAIGAQIADPRRAAPYDALALGFLTTAIGRAAQSSTVPGIRGTGNFLQAAGSINVNVSPTVLHVGAANAGL
jgi:hypothetical protein